jgi:hypothetical protein
VIANGSVGNRGVCLGVRRRLCDRKLSQTKDLALCVRWSAQPPAGVLGPRRERTRRPTDSTTHGLIVRRRITVLLSSESISPHVKGARSIRVPSQQTPEMCRTQCKFAHIRTALRMRVRFGTREPSCRPRPKAGSTISSWSQSSPSRSSSILAFIGNVTWTSVARSHACDGPDRPSSYFVSASAAATS